MKLLANENIPLPAVHFLRNLGYDIVSVGIECPGVSDAYIMEIAQTEGRTIITFDRDYGELIYKHNYQPPNGVIYLRLATYTAEEPGSIVHRLFEEYEIKPERTLTVFDGLMVRQRKY